MMSVRWLSMLVGACLDVLDEVQHRAGGHGLDRLGHDGLGHVARGGADAQRAPALAWSTEFSTLLAASAGLVGDVRQAGCGRRAGLRRRPAACGITPSCCMVSCSWRVIAPICW